MGLPQHGYPHHHGFQYMAINWIPGLVNVYITMDNLTVFYGKTHYKWPFSIAMLNYQRVHHDLNPRFSGTKPIFRGQHRLGMAWVQSSKTRPRHPWNGHARIPEWSPLRFPKRQFCRVKFSPVVNIKIAGIMDDILDDYGMFTIKIGVG
jgi:hypothetical protein